MKVEFDNIEEKALPEFKGGMKEYNAKMYKDDDVLIMKGRLVPGASIGLHTHETSCEVIFVTAGTGLTIEDGVEKAVAAGDVFYCQKGHEHTLINNGAEDLTFNAVVPNM